MTASISAEPGAVTAPVIGVPAAVSAAAATTGDTDRSVLALPNLAPERRKRGRPRDPEADGRILDAAAGLILENGFDHMTVDDVASRAKVGKATVYRRWSKKEDLALAAMSRLYSEGLPVPDTGNVRSDVSEWFRISLAFANSEAGLNYMRTSIAECSRDPRIAALYRAANDAAEEKLAQVFERGILRGEVRPDLNIVAAVQMITGLIIMRVVQHQQVPPMEDCESLVDLVLLGALNR
ncbi:TetR/AcrR family transcriptional regulator [Nocardioides mangrovicus]|uniref:TetR/AcrR family transcriptional regulator n=1 Tax=Nocardioides mangrovicus TaxID=2478913 RepID=UPI0011C47508|nr:TetR/AcrR family transcriptional regulator [Nocardioides mangrovicus]